MVSNRRDTKYVKRCHLLKCFFPLRLLYNCYTTIYLYKLDELLSKKRH